MNKKDREKENMEELLYLIKENPELPVVPIKESEIGGSGYGYYLGAFGFPFVDEYIIAINDDERVLFKSTNDVFDTLERYLSYEELEVLPESEEECRTYYDKLPWVKAIIIPIFVYTWE